MVEQVASARRLRAAIAAMLPYGPSLVPMDILIEVIEASESKDLISVNQLIKSLPHSTTGVRYNIDRMIDDGWLLKSRCSRDRRVVRLAPTQPAVDALREVIRKSRC